MLLAMHIPDGFLDPLATAATWLTAALGVGYSLRRLRGELGDRLVPLLGVTAAGIFAAQMVNFPLIGLQTSGHLMGGVLAGVVLGPWGAIVALTAVLVVQCLLFGDGGLTALGANITNMGLIGGGLGYAIYAPLRRAVGGRRGIVFAAVVASWLIIPVAALAFVAQIAVGGWVKVFPLATWMLFYHVLIALGEALLTGLAVSWLVRTRPELVYDPLRMPGRIERTGQATAAVLLASLAVAVLLAPWACGYADGLERAAELSGISGQGASWLPAPFPDYALREPGVGGVAAPPALAGVLAHAPVVTSVLGLIGTLATFGFATAVARCSRSAAAEARGASRP